MQARIELLEAQVAQLQLEVRRLRELVGVEEDEFEVIATVPTTPVSAGARASPQASPAQSSASSAYPLPGRGPSSNEARTRSLPRTERDTACREIGLWLLRNLAGDHRGTSGRDRLPQGSRLWLVARDFEGNTFNPPRVYTSFPQAKAITKRGSDLGASVLIGLPSRADLDAVLAATDWAAPVFY